MTLTMSRDEYDAVRRLVAPFTSRDSARPVLNHVHVRVRNRRREYTATDSYRLARWRGHDPAEPADPVLVHWQQLKPATKAGTVTVDTAPVEGKVPDYEGVLRNTEKANVYHPLTGDDLLGGAAHIKAADRPPYALLRVRRDTLLVEHRDVDDVHYDDVYRVKLDETPPALWCAVNGKFFHDLVKACRGECVLWLPEDPLAAVWFTADRWTALLMPVRA